MTNKFLSKPEVLSVSGLSHVTQWRMEKRGEFPKRRQISPNRVGWLESEINEWMHSRPVSKIDAVGRGGIAVIQSEVIYLNNQPLGRITFDTQSSLFAFLPVDGISPLSPREWRDLDQLKQAIYQAYESKLSQFAVGGST